MSDVYGSGAGRWRGAINAILPYFRPRPLVALLLGVSSGFPLTLLIATMGFWLARVGIDKATIGFAIGLTTPYTLKWLWAPLIDRIALPGLTPLFGQRRAWLFLVQTLLFLSLAMLGFSAPEKGLAAFAFWAIVTAFLSATQDIVIDAYRIEILDDAELPYGTANNQFGYRLGNFIAGVGTVLIASPQGLNLGWGWAYTLTGLCVIPAALGALWAGQGVKPHQLSDDHPANLGEWLTQTIIGPFGEFLKRRGAILILLFVLLYKVGDAMGQAMLNPMIVELGFTDTEFLAINKVLGVWALLVGTALAPPFMAWLGMGRALVISGILMMVSNFGFVLLALHGHSNFWLALAVGTEQVTSGLGLTVFVTYLSGLSNVAYTATQFALLSSLASVGRTWLAAPSGIVAKALGWPGFWGLTMVAALPGLLLLLLLWRRGFVVETARQPGAG